MAKAKSERKKVTTTTGLSVGELAHALGDISEHTVYRWVGAGCPHTRKAGRLSFDLKSVRDWHAARRGSEPPGKMGKPSAIDAAPADVKERIAIATLRKLTAQAEKQELDLAARRSLYLPREDVEAGQIARIVACKAGLLSLPARMGARCANRDALEVEQFARAEVERLLEEFSGVKTEEVVAL